MDNRVNRDFIHTKLQESQENEYMMKEQLQRLCDEYEERTKLLEETVFELRNHVEVLERDNFELMKDKVNMVAAKIPSKKKKPNKSRV